MDGGEGQDGGAGPVDEVRAALHVEGTDDDGRLVAPLVEAAGVDLGLADGPARHLAAAAAAVAGAVQRRGFDDPEQAALDVAVLRRGHHVVVQVDDIGVPFSYEDEEAVDGPALHQAVTDRWVDEVRHVWRGRDGNRTVLVRHLDPGIDLRTEPWDDLAQVEPVAEPLEVPVEARIATVDDVEGICRLTWRTYGPSYQHDEYYRPEQLARMIESGQQASFVVATEEDGIVGHTALLPEPESGVVVEGGRAMVDPRHRGHHVLGAAHGLRDPWLAEHGVLAIEGAAVTAHTRSQGKATPSHLSLGFLPPIEFAGIEGTETRLREAVVGGVQQVGAIPAQEVLLPEQDADVLETLYQDAPFERSFGRGTAAPPTAGTSTIGLHVRADLGHAVLAVHELGADLDGAVAARLGTVARAGIEVSYVDLPLSSPATTWAADVLARRGWILAGVVPLALAGTDVVRYQHLGDLVVDPAAIHLRSPVAQGLLAYVLAQREERR